jgi:hypothetical protein
MFFILSTGYLPALIHLVTRELSTRIRVAQIIHQHSILPRSKTTRNPLQPAAEKFIESGVTPSFISGKLSVGLIDLEDNILARE